MAKPKTAAVVYGRGSLIAGIIAMAMFAGMAVLQYGVFRGASEGDAPALSVAVCAWLPVFLGVIAFGIVCAVLSLVRDERPATMAWVGMLLCVACLTWFVVPYVLPRG